MPEETSIQFLPGVGPKMAVKLKRLGIVTVRDLLFYYPRSYADYSNPQNIGSLRIGEDAIVKAKIFSINQARTRRKWMSIVTAELADDSGKIKAIWFNQPYLLNVLKVGQEYLFSGKVCWDFQKKEKSLAVNNIETEPIILPIYSETEGITSKYIRKLVRPLVDHSDTYEVSDGKKIEEYLPAEILKSENLINISDAIGKIHFPKKLIDIDAAKKRLAFDELFLIALQMLINKKELLNNNAIALKFNKELLKQFVNKLPYKLTNAQRKSAWEIILDLEKTIPMNRLLEGDVGSGKTVVAAMAVLVAAKAGFQTVWLAPTEILANQHFINVSKLLKPFKIKVGLWTSANKKSNLQKDDLIIGTHALIQKDITFKKLALIIVDEQHRFGVKQRSFLRTAESKVRKANTVPHFLSMTATPIPRTLALAFYGDLDLSIIDEMPEGRQKIITKVVAPESRQNAYNFIENQVKQGRQVFVICPLIEPKDALKVNLFESDRKSVMEEYDKLSTKIFPKLRIGLMHGKMKSSQKDEVMEKFKIGKIDILVSTAVIEVGIDIANATVIMIESAERFGLAQLHQFRGRVGRGVHQSYCLLFSENQFENNKKRLEAMTACDDGFKLAEIDLKLRGPGELIGIRQSGLPDLKMASLSDIILIKKARGYAETIVTEGLEKYPKLQNKLDEMASEKHLE